MIAALLVSATAGRAADYAIDPTHSHILFTIDHLGFAKMVGLFGDFSGNISFDANNVPASKLNVTIKTDSLQTQFAPREPELGEKGWSPESVDGRAQMMQSPPAAFNPLRVW